MRHPIALAALATSTTLLVAALHAARPALFFFAFGAACFAVAGMVRDADCPETLGPLFWLSAGAVHLAAFAAVHEARASDPSLLLLAMLGFAYLFLGTVAWVRARFS